MTRKLYTGERVDISFDLDICQHSGVCVRGLPEVFNLKARPWINADADTSISGAERLVDLVSNCPSKALIIERANLEK